MKLNNYEIKGIIKVALLFFAFLIGFSSLWFTNNLVKKLASQERDKIATWANATRQIASSDGDNDINFIYEYVCVKISQILTSFSVVAWLGSWVAGISHTAAHL